MDPMIRSTLACLLLFAVPAYLTARWGSGDSDVLSFFGIVIFPLVWGCALTWLVVVLFAVAFGQYDGLRAEVFGGKTCVYHPASGDFDCEWR